ncbi:UNVERIFIED_CONTAM: hypothetical protein K2H54_001537 [Gekko kuhli]
MLHLAYESKASRSEAASPARLSLQGDLIPPSVSSRLPLLFGARRLQSHRKTHFWCWKDPRRQQETAVVAWLCEAVPEDDVEISSRRGIRVRLQSNGCVRIWQQHLRIPQDVRGMNFGEPKLPLSNLEISVPVCCTENIFRFFALAK